MPFHDRSAHQSERSVVDVDVVVVVVDHSGHGHDHVYDYDLLPLSRDCGLLLARVDQPELSATVGGSP